MPGQNTQIGVCEKQILLHYQIVAFSKINDIRVADSVGSKRFDPAIHTDEMYQCKQIVTLHSGHVIYVFNRF